jgi:EAL domain-containing protein (putative c-di-GMP-specific phosphodiesterase class I)
LEDLKKQGYMLIALEITESSFLCDMNKAIDVLHRVRELGIQVALDDFGSGFSSLNYLKRLPVDYIKIDRSFVHDLPDDNESRAITTSVIHLAHQLNMKVIAEGVETKQQLDFLTEHQVDFVQGYYYFRPMPFAELQTLQEKSW